MARPLLNRLTQRSERRSHLGTKQHRLLPSGEMAAFLEPVVINEFRVRLLGPASRGRIDFVRESANGDRERDASDVEETSSRRNLRRIPVEARRRDRSVGQPVQGYIVQNVVSRETLG